MWPRLGCGLGATLPSPALRRADLHGRANSVETVSELENIYANWIGGGPLVQGVNLWLELKPILIVMGVWVGMIGLLIFLRKKIDYRIGPKHLKVTLLGLTLRRVRLDNIRGITAQRAKFAERWHNRFFHKNDRYLVIQKRSGLCKQLEITPEQRFVFKAELDRAIRELMGLPPPAKVGDWPVLEQIEICGSPDEGATPASEKPADNSPPPPPD